MARQERVEVSGRECYHHTKRLEKSGGVKVVKEVRRVEVSGREQYLVVVQQDIVIISCRLVDGFRSITTGKIGYTRDNQQMGMM